MSTATTVVGSIVVVLGTFALLGFVLMSANTATAGERYAAFETTPERGATSDYDREAMASAEPPPTEAEAEAEAESSTEPPRGSPATTTLGASVTFSTPVAAQWSLDGAPERTLFRLTGGSIAGAAEHPSGVGPSAGRATSTALPNVQLTASYSQPLRLRRFGQGPSDSPT